VVQKEFLDVERITIAKNIEEHSLELARPKVISTATAKFAAEYWANYLSNITQEQHDNFIESLTDKILTRHGYRGSYIKVYSESQIIEESLEDAKINFLASILDKMSMRIYTTGHIILYYGDELFGYIDESLLRFTIIYTNTLPSVKHLTLETLDFSNAPYVKIKGPDFRLLEIDITDHQRTLYDICTRVSWIDEGISLRYSLNEITLGS
jgi:hypothetical protein